MYGGMESPGPLAGGAEALVYITGGDHRKHTPTPRRLQAARVARQFGLKPATAALIASLAFEVAA